MKTVEPSLVVTKTCYYSNIQTLFNSFLDENEDIEDEDVFGRNRQKRSSLSNSIETDRIRSDYHVVYKRKDHLDHISDYRKCLVHNTAQ